MISIPIAVNVPVFKWQLEIFWMQHQNIYGEDAVNRAKAVVIRRNFPNEEIKPLIFNTPGLPIIEVDGVSEKPFPLQRVIPLNIQIGVSEAIKDMDDETIIEVLDCDMFHLKPRDIIVAHNIVLCDPIYENWHLKSLTDNKQVIQEFIIDEGRTIYNGGFVPIVCTVKTMRKIIDYWADIHYAISQGPWDERTIKWWAGMYALQAACQRAGVVMESSHDCYIPPVNQFSEQHTIAHYSVDGEWADKKGPKRKGSNKNAYTKAIKEYVKNFK